MDLAKAELFAAKHIQKGLADRDQKGEFHRAGWDACAKEGIQSIVTREPVDKVFPVLQGMGRGTADVGFLLALNAHIWGIVWPLHRMGDTSIAPDAAAGKIIGTHAISEPEAGSDLQGMKTVAVRDGDGYRLTGTKTWITNAPVGDVFLVYAKQDKSDRAAALSVFALKKDEVKLTKTFEKMGLRTAPMGEIEFDARIPADRLIGKEGSGMTQFHTALEMERAGIFASILGVMETQLKQTIQRARTRKAFDKPIGSFQSVSNRVVDMKMRVDMGQLLLNRFVDLKKNDRRAPMESAMLKLFLGESFVESSIDAVRIHGALGYLEDQGFARNVRDAIGGLLFSGTADIQRNTMAKLLGLDP